MGKYKEEIKAVNGTAKFGDDQSVTINGDIWTCTGMTFADAQAIYSPRDMAPGDLFAAFLPDQENQNYFCILRVDAITNIAGAKFDAVLTLLGISGATFYGPNLTGCVCLVCGKYPGQTAWCVTPEMQGLTKESAEMPRALTTLYTARSKQDVGQGGSTMKQCLNDADEPVKGYGKNAAEVAKTLDDNRRTVAADLADQVKKEAGDVAGLGVLIKAVSDALNAIKGSQVADDSGIAYEAQAKNVANAIKALNALEVKDVGDLNTLVAALKGRLDGLDTTGVKDASNFAGASLTATMNAIKAKLDAMGGGIAHIKMGADTYDCKEGDTLDLSFKGTAYGQLDKATGHVSIGAAGSEQFAYYTATVKMKYGSTIFITDKMAPIKNKTFTMAVLDEEYPGTNIWSFSTIGMGDNPSNEYCTLLYETMDEHDQVYTELRIDRLVGRTDVECDVVIAMIVYIGEVKKLQYNKPTAAQIAAIVPQASPFALAPSAQSVGGYKAHVTGVTNIITEQGAHEWGFIYRPGNDFDLIAHANIDPSWRSNAGGFPVVKLFKTEADKGRTILAIVQPGYVKGHPVLKVVYTNPTGGGMKPNGTVKVRFFTRWCDPTNHHDLKNYDSFDKDVLINWNGEVNTIGYFEVEGAPLYDCRSCSGVMVFGFCVLPPTINTDTIDIVSAKIGWLDVIQKENT